MNNVLIVDDDILVADVIRRIVEQTPAFKCCGIALSLGQAKEIISVNKKLADLILLDLYINKDNGLDLLPFLHSIHCKSDVIVISAADDSATIKDSLHYSVSDYLIKPFHISRLVDSLTRWKHKKTLLESQKIFNQSELDLLTHKIIPNTEKIRHLPKGLSTDTLRIICRWIDEHQHKKFTLNELASGIKISRISCRKYIIWLVSCHILAFDFSCGVTGRPAYRYWIRHQYYPYIKKYSEKP
ncbi:TPA: two-component system response regulator DcuR [Escherichia coli]|nr:two-component system response regulator DcuR [Escherichia coli]